MDTVYFPKKATHHNIKIIKYKPHQNDSLNYLCDDVTTHIPHQIPQRTPHFQYQKSFFRVLDNVTAKTSIATDTRPKHGTGDIAFEKGKFRIKIVDRMEVIVGNVVYVISKPNDNTSTAKSDEPGIITVSNGTEYFFANDEHKLLLVTQCEQEFILEENVRIYIPKGTDAYIKNTEVKIRFMNDFTEAIL